MLNSYRDWLKAQEYSANTQVAQLHRVAKVEQYYGSLDEIYQQGRYEELIGDLSYSAEDERHGKPNPSRIVFDGNIRNNLQSYKNAVVRYRKFLLQGFDSSAEAQTASAVAATPDSSPAEYQKLSLERDMQAALRREIGQLEPGLKIVDDGAERAVSSGFIDILCEDSSGTSVVIELKAGKTDARVVGQILGYMGDVMEDDGISNVRGIIVAHEFDKRTVAASKAVPNLKLMRYSISFRFEAGT